jgi:hypothetical protein
MLKPEEVRAVPGAAGGNFWARSHPCAVIEPCDWIQANFGTILDASKLDNGTWGPNHFCKSTGGCPGRN